MTKQKVMSPARKGLIPLKTVKAAVKAVLGRGSKKEKVGKGKDITMRDD